MMTAVLLAAAAMATPSGTAVGVSLSEYEVALGRQRAPVGKVRFNITNFGEDGHDFAVRNRWGRIVARSPEIPSNGRYRLKHRFRTKGRFTLVCVLDGHEDLGMKAPFRTVRKKKNRRSRR